MPLRLRAVRRRVAPRTGHVPLRLSGREQVGPVVQPPSQCSLLQGSLRPSIPPLSPLRKANTIQWVRVHLFSRYTQISGHSSPGPAQFFDGFSRRNCRSVGFLRRPAFIAKQAPKRFERCCIDGGRIFRSERAVCTTLCDFLPVSNLEFQLEGTGGAVPPSSTVNPSLSLSESEAVEITFTPVLSTMAMSSSDAPLGEARRGP